MFQRHNSQHQNPGFLRQRYSSLLRQEHGRTYYQTVRSCRIGVGVCYPSQCSTGCVSHWRSVQYSCRPPQSSQSPTRMAAESQCIPSIGRNVGSTYYRSLRLNDYHTPESLQQPIHRSPHFLSRRPVPNRLVGREQFCKSTVSPPCQSFKHSGPVQDLSAP